MYRDSYEFKPWTVGKIEYASSIEELTERIKYLTEMTQAIETEKEFILNIREKRIWQRDTIRHTDLAEEFKKLNLENPAKFPSYAQFVLTWTDKKENM